MDFVESFITLDSITKDEQKLIQSAVNSFCIVLYRKFKKSHFNLKKCEQSNEAWLNQAIISSGCAENQGGRPRVEFASASLKVKKRLVKPLLETHSKEELALATEISYRASGSKNAASAIQQIAETPSQATKFKNYCNKGIDKDHDTFSPEEALALFIDLQLSQTQYQYLRNALKSKGLKDVFPSYHKLLSAKKECYPDNLSVSEKVAEVDLQSVLDHTTNRLIINTQKEVLYSFTCNNTNMPINLKMFCKWGADGSGGKNSFKQEFQTEAFDDTSIMTTSFVPLRLVYEDNDKNTILWKNPRVSSTRFCRPVRIQYVKENNEIIKKEFSKVQEDIDRLKPAEIFIGDRHFLIHYIMYSTMVDGKVCNALMDSSSQKCYICRAGPKEFNNLDNIRSRDYDISSLNFGISPLHAYIRSFECFLHIAYRLDFCTWKTSKDVKHLMENRKKKIIEDFRKETGLLVDTPKQGFGSSNDGNTARRFFGDPQKSSSITGIDETLIYRFSVLLRALNSDFKIDTSKFKPYALRTAELYIELYP